MKIQSMSKTPSTKTVVVADAAFEYDATVKSYAMQAAGETPESLTFMGAKIEWLYMHTAKVTMYTD